MGEPKGLTDRSCAFFVGDFIYLVKQPQLLFVQVVSR